MDPFLVTSLVVTVIAFTAIWLIHVPLEDAGIVDYYWGPGFAVIGWSGLAFGAEGSPAKFLLLAAVTLWAARLAIQLVMRHRLMHGEDARYRKMRMAGGPQWWWRSLYKVFLLQAVILWLVATPVHAIVGAPARSKPFDCSDTPVWLAFLAGLAIESGRLAALPAPAGQGRAGRRDHASGLWAYSRHPNYLGEIVLWFGLGLAAYDLSGAWWALAGPVALAAVIRLVSLPLTEQHLMASRSDYADLCGPHPCASFRCPRPVNKADPAE
jgi:steroid 5-alpha reductase family enzyme